MDEKEWEINKKNKNGLAKIEKNIKNKICI